MTDEPEGHQNPDLDRERFEFQKQQSKAELDLKKNEQKDSHWIASSNVLIGIGAAFLTGALNIYLAFQNNMSQLELEHRKAENTLVLEMIRTDQESAKKNLQFLVDTGLLSDKSRVDSISAYLNKIKGQPGEGPSLKASLSPDSRIFPVPFQPGAYVVCERDPKTGENADCRAMTPDEINAAKEKLKRASSSP